MTGTQEVSQSEDGIFSLDSHLMGVFLALLSSFIGRGCKCLFCLHHFLAAHDLKDFSHLLPFCKMCPFQAKVSQALQFSVVKTLFMIFGHFCCPVSWFFQLYCTHLCLGSLGRCSIKNSQSHSVNKSECQWNEPEGEACQRPGQECRIGRATCESSGPFENSPCVYGIQFQCTWEAKTSGEGLLSLSLQCPLIAGIDLSLNTDIII